jgi:hypothetical protein
MVCKEPSLLIYNLYLSIFLDRLFAVVVNLTSAFLLLVSLTLLDSSLNYPAQARMLLSCLLLELSGYNLLERGIVSSLIYLCIEVTKA